VLDQTGNRVPEATFLFNLPDPTSNVPEPTSNGTAAVGLVAIAALSLSKMGWRRAAGRV
jgi:hypothetical protein